jgi:hypothetical protein
MQIESKDDRYKGVENAVLCWPPSLCMASTKRRWRSGVHLRRGTLDRLYCLTAPSTLSLPAIALSIVVPREWSLKLHPRKMFSGFRN